MLGRLSLATRRSATKLRFRCKILEMDDLRLPKQVLLEPTLRHTGARVPLRAVTGPIIRKDPDLRKTFKHLAQVLEEDVTPLEDEEAERERKTRVDNARGVWFQQVKRWAIERELGELAKAGHGVRKQARLTARALKGIQSLKPLPVSQGVGSENGIRRRLMAGSAAVNALMAKTTLGRSAKCTICGADSESIEHFVLKCPLLMDIRANHMKEVFSTCKCETPCLRTFGSLGGQTEDDRLARCAFLMGGPVDGLIPCAEADACFDAMITAMWKARAERLEKEYGLLKSNKGKNQRQGPRESPDIRRAFGNKPQGGLPIPSPCGGTSVRTLSHSADDVDDSDSNVQDDDDDDDDDDDALRATEPAAADAAAAPAGSANAAAENHEPVPTRPPACSKRPLLTKDLDPPYITYMPRHPLGGVVEAYVSDQLRN